MYIVVGINYPGHDTSVAILVDGKIVSACEQERFDLNKHSRKFPYEALQECLSIANLTLDLVNEIAIGFDHKYHIREAYLKPALDDDGRLNALIRDIDKIKKIFNVEEKIRDETGYKGKINHYRHHDCHLASCYYPSGFNRSLVVSYDGLGEMETGILAIGEQGDITPIYQDQKFPHSLGLIYAAITSYLGWTPTCDEGIIMGLAPYGNADEKVPGHNLSYYDVFSKIIKIKSNLEYEISLDWISYYYERDTWVSRKFIEFFGERREYGAEVSAHHINIAAALQKRVEDVVIGNLTFLKNEYSLNYLCISGGVGLNCSLNGKISSAEIFDEIYVQPASGDAGIAIGACYCAYKKKYPKYISERDDNSYLGSRYSDESILKSFKNHKLTAIKSDQIDHDISLLLSKGQIVAWFQGGAEFGPRALGNRSILAKPYPKTMKDHINNKVKFRESFRPFAPAIMYEYLEEYFELNQESPHMLLACQAKKEKIEKISATVHVDSSARVQTVTREGNRKFYDLLKSFNDKTGVPVLLNTSFNVKGQPVVNTPDQAIETFMSTKIDVLCIGDYYVIKEG
jgi:carbamoyltransferase